MKLKVFLAIFLFAGAFCVKAQEGLVKFEPQLIDSHIISKPFFKPGLLFTVDDVRFENDTNYFTVYLINNTDSAVFVPVIHNIDKHSGSVAALTLQHLPGGGQPYKIIAEICNRTFSVHDIFIPRILDKGYYLVQKIKIPCRACRETNLIDCRLEVFDYTDIELGKTCYYYSNGFQFYYDSSTCCKYNLPDYFLLDFPEYDYSPGASRKRISSQKIVDSLSHDHSVFVKGIFDDTILKSTLKRFPAVLKVYKNGYETKEYTVDNAIIRYVKNTWELQHTGIVTQDRISNESLEMIKSLSQGDMVYFSFIEVKDELGQVYKARPFCYTVR